MAHLCATEVQLALRLHLPALVLVLLHFKDFSQYLGAVHIDQCLVVVRVLGEKLNLLYHLHASLHLVKLVGLQLHLSVLSLVPLLGRQDL